MTAAKSGKRLDHRSSERQRLRDQIQHQLRRPPTPRRQLVVLVRLALGALGGLSLAPQSWGWADLAMAQQQHAALHVGSEITVEPATAMPLAIQIRPQGSVPKNHFVRIRGLPPAAVLSEGHAISPGAWAVPLVGLPNLKITVPNVTLGRFNVAVSLLTVDGTVLDDAKMVLIVGAPALAGQERARQSGPSATVASLGPSAASVPETTSAEQKEALKLHTIGLAHLGRGNIAAARMFFRRATESGLPQSALALGGTYDPVELAKLKVIGLRPDQEAARKWYQRARDLGSIEATGRLQRLGAQ